MSSKKIIHLAILFSTVALTRVSGQNFAYVEGDWDIKTTPMVVNAITENTWEVYFATDDGIYVWDKMNKTMSYGFTLSHYLDAKMIYHMFYDINTDFFWVVHENGVSYKPAIGTYWTQTSLPVIGRGVDEIGSTDGNIWLKYQGKYLALDPFNGNEVTPDEFVDTNFIKWGSSRFGEAGERVQEYTNDLQNELSTSYDNRNLFSPVQATLVMTDTNRNHWIGTNRGFVVKQSPYRSGSQKIYLGSPLNHVTTLYYDQNRNWWLGDNVFKRTGQITNLNQQNNFIYRWYEKDNQWTDFYLNDIGYIKDTNINCILRVKYFLYVGTVQGLLILNVADERWDFVLEGLGDPSVWDMVEKDGKLYLATARGVWVMSVPQNSIDETQPEFLYPLSNSQIFDLDIKDKDLFVATDSGVFRFDLISGDEHKITSTPYKSISAQGNSLILGKKGLFTVNNHDELTQIYEDEVFKFAVNGKFVWLTDMKDAILLDMDTGKNMRYSSVDGIPGTTIYNINCDDNWVWFGTDKGFAIYNWSRYHK